MGLSELGALGICIDEYDAGEMRGRIYSALHEEPYTFNSVITLVKCVNGIFDEGDYPQATMRCRGFNKKDKDTDSAPMEEKTFTDPSKLNVLRTNMRGKKATFRVKVMFRQNASWQGMVCWVEKNREESFRSVLELMMLIDSAFEAERAAKNESSDESISVNM